MIAKTGPNGIPARQDNVPGRAAVTSFVFDGEVLTSSGPTEAYNLSIAPIPPNTWVLLEKIGPHHFVGFRDLSLESLLSPVIRFASEEANETD